LAELAMMICNEDDLVSRNDNTVRFCPSHVEGLEGVGEVAIHVDRLEVNVDGQWRSFRFADIGRRQESALASYLRRLCGGKALPRLVGERDWCRPPRERFFRWYTDPPLTMFMPEDEGEAYSSGYFPLIHAVLQTGAFSTIDLA